MPSIKPGLARFLYTVAGGAAIVLVVMASYIIGPSAAGTLFTSTADATVVNTVTETTIIGTGTGSLILSAGYCVVGRSVLVNSAGRYSTGATPGTLTIRLKLNSTVAGTTGAQTPAVSQTDRFWGLVPTLITFRTCGAAGTVSVQSAFLNNTSATADQLWGMPNSATVTIDTTIDQTVGLTAQWGTAGLSETITGTNFAMATYDSGTGGAGGLPAQGGNAAKFLQTDGTAASWQFVALTDAFASRPAAAAGNQGQVFFPNNGFFISRSTGSTWASFGPLLPLTEPVDADFAWINQGTATVSTTNGGVVLTAPALAGTNLRIRKKAAPATPYTITALFIPTLQPANFAECGILFRASAAGTLAMVRWTHDSTNGGHRLFVSKFTSPTVFSANYVGPFQMSCHSNWLIFRIADDGVNRISSFSCDGVNFIQVHSVVRTDFLTADEVGFACESAQATGPAIMGLLSWVQG